MIQRSVLSFVMTFALLVGVGMPSAGRAQTLKQLKAAEKKEIVVLTEEIKLEEATVLRKAFILLAEANHDYSAHRAHAMHALKSAVKMLDHDIQKRGTAAQKAASTQEQVVMAKAEAVLKKTAQLHEPQPASDRQLRKAAVLLAEVRPTLIRHNQTPVLKHLDKAVGEINIALKIR